MEQRINHMEYMPGMEIIESDVMEQVISKMDAYDCEKYTANNVLIALKKDVLDIEDFAALLSPAALPLLEEMAKRAKLETRKHFGNSVYMFTPLYIANYCENYCIYCGFNCHNKIKRARLNAEEIEKIPNYGVLLLPSVVALSQADRDAIKKFRQRGGSILSTWLTGVRTENGDWVG